MYGLTQAKNKIKSLKIKIDELLNLENRVIVGVQESSWPSEAFIGGNISQVDGCCDPPRQNDAAVQTESSVQNLAYDAVSGLSLAQISSFHCTHTISSAQAQDCKYCDQEFATWSEFIEYMKQFSFMCNGCLDYFPEKPWFLSKEIIMIDVGSGDQLYLNTPHITLPPRHSF